MATPKIKVQGQGIASISSQSNNTIVTIANPNGDVIASASGGRFQKGARKSTAHAGEEAAKYAAGVAVELGMTQVHVNLRGAGNGRDSGVRGLHAGGLTILSISELTGIPHNGCRRKKKKRI